jgi:hypothetical protein
MKLRSRLTYANVAATLALFLVIAGGTVYAASELGRNDVKSKNIAKGAVKTSDLHGNAVTGPKVKDGSITGGDVQDESLTGGDLQDGTVTGADVQDGGITGADIAAGVIPQIKADVTGSATGGPQGGINANTTSPLPLTGTTSFTPNDGEVAALAAEGQFTIATTNGAQFCQPAVRVLVNGEPTRIFVEPGIDGNNTTPLTSLGHDADGPLGLLNPGTPLDITAELLGDPDCTAGSQLDKFQLSIVQIH